MNATHAQLISEKTTFDRRHEYTVKTYRVPAASFQYFDAMIRRAGGKRLMSSPAGLAAEHFVVTVRFEVTAK